MKTLSVRNPYAVLICSGIKDVENRGYNTAQRGRILIHACGEPMSWINSGDMPSGLKSRIKLSVDSGIARDELIGDVAAFDSIIRRCINHYQLPENIDDVANPKQAMIDALKKHGAPFPSGAIIGEVEIIDVVTDSKSEWAIPYKKHWVLENAVLYDNPIKGVKGHLGLWDFDIESHR